MDMFCERYIYGFMKNHQVVHNMLSVMVNDKIMHVRQKTIIW